MQTAARCLGCCVKILLTISSAPDHGDALRVCWGVFGVVLGLMAVWCKREMKTGTLTKGADIIMREALMVGTLER